LSAPRRRELADVTVKRLDTLAARSEIATGFEVGAVVVGEAAEEAEGRAGEGVDAEDEAPVLGGDPAEAGAHQAVAAVQAVDEEELGLPGAELGAEEGADAGFVLLVD